MIEQIASAPDDGSLPFLLILGVQEQHLICRSNYLNFDAYGRFSHICGRLCLGKVVSRTGASLLRSSERCSVSVAVQADLYYTHSCCWGPEKSK